MTADRKRPRLNRAAAIREHCFECQGYQRQQINRCPDTACPLWEWRKGPGRPERTVSPLRRQQGTQTPTDTSVAVVAPKTGDEAEISEDSEEVKP